jgi:hypothetical protein
MKSLNAVEPSRKLHFDDKKTLGILLNILGHDPIHDYLNNEDRWEMNLNLINQFTDYTLTFSLPFEQPESPPPISSIGAYSDVITSTPTKGPNTEKLIGGSKDVIENINSYNNIKENIENTFYRYDINELVDKLTIDENDSEDDKNSKNEISKNINSFIKQYDEPHKNTYIDAGVIDKFIKCLKIKIRDDRIINEENVAYRINKFTDFINSKITFATYYNMLYYNNEKDDSINLLKYINYTFTQFTTDDDIIEDDGIKMINTAKNFSILNDIKYYFFNYINTKLGNKSLDDSLKIDTLIELTNNFLNDEYILLSIYDYSFTVKDELPITPHKDEHGNNGNDDLSIILNKLNKITNPPQEEPLYTVGFIDSPQVNRELDYGTETPNEYSPGEYSPGSKRKLDKENNYSARSKKMPIDGDNDNDNVDDNGVDNGDDDDDDDYGSMTRMSGGAKTTDEQLDQDEASNIVKDLNELKTEIISSGDLDNLAGWFMSYINNPDQQVKTNYNSKRIEILNKIKIKLRDKGQTAKAGSVDNASSNSSNKISFIPVLPERGSRVITDNGKYKEIGFFKYFDEGLVGYYTDIIKKYELEQKLLEYKKSKDADKAAKGELGAQQRSFKNNFCKIIAKTALYLNGIIDKNGIIIDDWKSFLNDSNNSTNENSTNENYLLYHEINVLINEADLKKANGNITISTGNLDTYLYNITERHLAIQKYDNIDPDIRCGNKPPPLYIIDNAAKFPSVQLKERVFCPYTSMFDAMKQCPLSTRNDIEFGNMNFSIINDSETFKYNGKLTINGDNRNIDYEIEVKPFNHKEIILKNDKFKNMNTNQDSKLKAHNVLKETLSAIIIYVKQLLEHDNENHKSIFSQDDIFEYLFMKTNIDQFNAFIQNLYTILYKGAGDLFQEINALCKNGGYINGANYYNTTNLIKWNEDGDALRMFVANDQPSGCRFINILKYGKLDEINNYAFGGYSGDYKSLIYSRLLEIVYSNLKESAAEPNIKDVVCNPGKYTSNFKNSGGKPPRKTKNKRNKITRNKKTKNNQTKKHKRTKRRKVI